MRLINPSGIVGLLLVLTCFLLYRTLRKSREVIERQKRSLDYYKDTYIGLTGWNITIGSYDYHSFDSGQTWYNVERNGDGIRILGEADANDVKSVQAMRKLIAHVSQRGSLDLQQQSDLDLLTSAGFEVKSGS